MIVRSPTEHENRIFVMPAWIAGIQAAEWLRNMRVNWVPVLHAGTTQSGGVLLEPSEASSSRIFKEEAFGRTL